MTEQLKKKLNALVSDKAIHEINENIKNYPAGFQQSAVMRALTIAQEECGHLTPPLMDAIADYLDMPAIAVYEVASFYSMYEHKPVGENIIFVCRSISCHLRGADKIVNELEQHLEVKCGETSPDGKFTLKTAECLGACVNAPMMQVNKTYHENLTVETLDAVLDQYQ